MSEETTFKVGEHIVKVDVVEKEDDAVRIVGTLEDGTVVEFYAYPEDGTVSAYELQDAAYDLDWGLTEEEAQDVLRFAREVAGSGKRR